MKRPNDKEAIVAESTPETIEFMKKLTERQTEVFKIIEGIIILLASEDLHLAATLDDAGQPSLAVIDRKYGSLYTLRTARPSDAEKILKGGTNG